MKSRVFKPMSIDSIVDWTGLRMVMCAQEYINNCRSS